MPDFTQRTFTSSPLIRSDVDELLYLYRPTSTVFASIGLDFDGDNDTPTRKTYGKIWTSLENTTNTTESSYIAFSYFVAGTFARRVYMNNNILFIGVTNTIGLVPTGLTAPRQFTFPDSAGVVTVDTATQNISNKTLYGMGWRVVTKSADATLADDELIVPVSASGANRTITLPAASGRTGKIYVIQKSDSSANTVTVDANASETINGALTFVLTAQYQGVVIWCDGSNWFTQPNSSERTGKAVASGNGSNTAFTIAHGLGSTPSNVFVDCSSHAIARTYTVDSTNISITFISAPSSGTNNVVIFWRAVA